MKTKPDNALEEEYVFDDEHGRHYHFLLPAPPYDFNMPLMCPACQARIRKIRSELCEKYGWSSWPEECSAVKML